MSISAYQIQNIIQTYNRQLKARLSDRASAAVEEKKVFPEDKVEISTEGKKRNFLERAGTESVRKLKQQALDPLKSE